MRRDVKARIWSAVTSGCCNRTKWPESTPATSIDVTSVCKLERSAASADRYSATISAGMDPSPRVQLKISSGHFTAR